MGINRDKRVSLWGCGAIGSVIAECLVRAGVRQLVLRDSAVVTPGVITRQFFSDADIGTPKAVAVASRLRAVLPAADIVTHFENVLTGPLETNEWADGCDIVIDSTVSNIVAAKLELRRHENTIDVPVAALVLGHRAERGMAVVCRPGHSGGPADVFRRTRLEVGRRPPFQHFADEFWPSPPRTDIFQPEPGCSESTFVGSMADVCSLASSLLNLVADVMTSECSATAHSFLITQPFLRVGQRHASFTWRRDHTFLDHRLGYQIRVSPSAWREMWGWINHSTRTNEPDVETGGLLFGRRDDAAKVIWVDEVLGPPPDSEASADQFICGVDGTHDAADEKARRSGSELQFVGMWHTHPVSSPEPSGRDLVGMAKLLSSAPNPPALSLLVIVGRVHDVEGRTGVYVFRADEISATHTTLSVSGDTSESPVPTAPGQ